MDMAIIKLQLVNYCEVVNGGFFEIGHSFISDMDECGSPTDAVLRWLVHV